ncbi:MAG TPA: protein kinase, partial [Gemmataceae bacterium]|nr:protein kinase [Gemmataceae bacterium]
MQQPIQMNAEPIPGYRLLERLGRGGFGEVWKAEAPGGMHKAIKFVFGDMEGVGEEGKAAEQEYKSLNRVKTIRHPFILSLERFEVINGQLVIVMELADCSLWDRYQECIAGGQPGIPRVELIAYLEEAAEALDLMNLHHQIQHLDIKPQNLFLVHRHIKVADFGLAKDLEGTMANLTGGITPVYAPPETFEGWVSRQSDQYSLAIVYQELLTGKRPFNGTNTRQLIMQHMSAVPDVSALPPADRTVVFRALSKAPADRFATCADFVAALKAEALPSGPSVAPAPSVDGGSRFGTTGDTPGYSSFATERAVRSRPAGLPALTTRSSKGGHTGPLSPHRRPVTEPGAARPAQRERVGEGVLFPALIVGVGGTGWGILRALRRLIQDQFDRPTLPHLRWLYVDTDAVAAESATSDPNV